MDQLDNLFIFQEDTMQARTTLPVPMGTNLRAAALIVMAILLPACSATGATGSVTEMIPQPTAMMATTTPGSMMSTPAGEMMPTPTGMMGTATPGAMMSTPTGELMGTAVPETMMGTPVTGMMGTGTPEAMKSDQLNLIGPVPWFSANLTNVSNGQAFTINDFKGKVILVETMAQWCPTCLSQEKQVKDLLTQLGMRDDLRVVGLDIDPNEDAATLKNYVAQNAFDWIFAISPADTSREIGNLYGAQFLNPPSTPMLIIDRKGVAHTLPFGVKSASDLLQALQPYLR
jgi:cytochrome oxidase Cu insertion factor (SCO1/SenC/PrrC family)